MPGHRGVRQEEAGGLRTESLRHPASGRGFDSPRLHQFC